MKLISNFKFQISNFTKGFTLIELLVVVAIIGILASLLMVNFIGVRQRGRDAQRKSDVKQIQSALELYRADQNSYPTTTNFPACGASLKSQDGTLIYMQKIPCDPLDSGQYVYKYTSTDGRTYSITACLENLNDPQKDSTNDDSVCTGGTTNWSYTAQNP